MQGDEANSWHSDPDSHDRTFERTSCVACVHLSRTENYTVAVVSWLGCRSNNTGQFGAR